MLSDKESAMDWKFVKVLNDVTATFDAQMDYCKKGGVIRDKHGSRIFWRDTAPTVKERRAAKKALPDAAKTGDITAACPCCCRTFLIPSEYISVKKHGVCKLCALWVVKGMWGGVMAYREPTLEEVLEIDLYDLRPAESEVLREAYLSVMDTMAKF